MADFGISGVEPLDTKARVLCFLKVVRITYEILSTFIPNRLV
jgi:hypothetical protein